MGGSRRSTAVRGGATQLSFRFIGLALRFADARKHDRRVDERRVEAKRTSQLALGRVVLPFGGVQLAQVVMGGRVRRVQRQRHLQRIDRIVGAPEVFERRGQVQLSSRIVRRGLDRVEIAGQRGLERSAVLVLVAERDLSVGNSSRLRRHGCAPSVARNERGSANAISPWPGLSRASRPPANGHAQFFARSTALFHSAVSLDA